MAQPRQYHGLRQAVGRGGGNVDSVYLSYMDNAPAQAQRPPQQQLNNSTGMRPLQLRQQPQQQQQYGGRPSHVQGGQLPPNSRPRPNIPTLQVTVPPPAHHQAEPPRSAQYARAPPSPGSPYSSTDTLIGSGQSHEKKPWSPYSSANSVSSPSIKNLQLVAPADALAHPENDRLSPATPGLAGQKDFWKRFSTVVRANQEQEQMAEKVGGKGAQAGAGSEWLDKQKTKERNYKFWVAGVAVLIIAGIAGGLAYHFITRPKDDPNAVASQPSKKDFGLGTLADEPESSTVPVQVQATASNTLPAASVVTAGATFRARSVALSEVYMTATPIIAGHGHGKRRQQHHGGHLADLD